MAGTQGRKQMFFCHVRVALRGGNRGMAEYLLDNADIRAEPQEKRGHCMADHVRRHPDRHTCGFRLLAEHPGNALGRDPLTGRIKKQSVRRPWHLQPARDICLDRRKRAVIRQKAQALPGSLAID
jgi:hypothetical protein